MTADEESNDEHDTDTQPEVGTDPGELWADLMTRPRLQDLIAANRIPAMEHPIPDPETERYSDSDLRSIATIWARRHAAAGGDPLKIMHAGFGEHRERVRLMRRALIRGAEEAVADAQIELKTEEDVLAGRIPEHMQPADILRDIEQPLREQVRQARFEQGVSDAFARVFGSNEDAG